MAENQVKDHQDDLNPPRFITGSSVCRRCTHNLATLWVFCLCLGRWWSSLSLEPNHHHYLVLLYLYYPAVVNDVLKDASKSLALMNGGEAGLVHLKPVLQHLGSSRGITKAGLAYSWITLSFKSCLLAAKTFNCSARQSLKSSLLSLLAPSPAPAEGRPALKAPAGDHSTPGIVDQLAPQCSTPACPPSHHQSSTMPTISHHHVCYLGGLGRNFRNFNDQKCCLSNVKICRIIR